MQLPAFLNRWIVVLAALFSDWRAVSQARKSIIVTREEERFVARRPGSAANIVVANVTAGAQVPSETAEALRNRFITFELAADKVVTRRITVPAQAQEFLPGIVRNQIERLSPWPPAQAIYGFAAKPSQDDAGVLDVCVLIAARTSIDAICNELTTSGLSPDRIAVRTDANSKAAPLTLWTRTTHAPQRKVQSLPRMIAPASPRWCCSAPRRACGPYILRIRLVPSTTRLPNAREFCNGKASRNESRKRSPR